MPVVNVRTVPCEVFIGRMGDTHEQWGNPFNYLTGETRNTVKVGSREEALVAFEMWLLGEAYEDVRPEQREWMLENLHTLKGKVLGCHCAPRSCHGDLLERLANEL